MHACICVDKVVQTTLPPDTYTRLSQRAKKEGKPLKAVVQEAIEAFLVQDLPAWQDDPFFQVIGSAPGLMESGPPGKPRTRDVIGKHRRKMDAWSAARKKG